MSIGVKLIIIKLFFLIKKTTKKKKIILKFKDNVFTTVKGNFEKLGGPLVLPPLPWTYAVVEPRKFLVFSLACDCLLIYSFWLFVWRSF